jgi:molecular chaperone GrpE (heat shock protein)
MFGKKSEVKKNHTSQTVTQISWVVDEQPFNVDAATVKKEIYSEGFTRFAEEVEKHWKEIFGHQSSLQEELSKDRDKKHEEMKKFFDRVVDLLWDKRPSYVKDLVAEKKELSDTEKQAELLWEKVENWLSTLGYKKIDCLGKLFDPVKNCPVNESKNLVVEAEVKPGFWDSQNNHLARLAIVRLKE